MLSGAADLSDAIDRIYGAVLDPAAWTPILTDIVDRAGGTQAILLRSDIVSGDGEVFLSRYNDEEAWVAYRAYYAAINPLHNVADPADYAAGWQPRMLRDEDWLPREEIEATEYYNDFLRPIDACFGLYVRLALDDSMLTTISVGRGVAQGRFNDGAMTALKPLHDHLIRAANLGRSYSRVRRFADSAIAALDAASDPLMLLDTKGRLVHANRAGEGLLSSGEIVRGKAGRLSTGARHLSARMDQAIALATDPNGKRASSFRLADRNGVSASDVNVLPIAPGSAFDAPGGPAILVRVGPAAAEDRAQAVLARFGLTTSERSLALSLVQGATLRETAEAGGISVNTARRHLASIFDKTGVHRQAELVRLLTFPG